MTNVKKLGELIEWVDTRNRSGISTNLLGINIEKYFMPSVANIIGTDLSSYKLIFKNQFACNPMHVGRDEKMPIALYSDEKPSIVSPAYFVFQVKDVTILNPEFLMLWFRRIEFDRECWFHTDGSVRGGITWDEILEMSVPVPSIEEQNRIVLSYNDIEKRIKLKRQINDNLESQALTLFHIKFQSRFDNLPDNWTKTTANAIFDVSIGKTPPREHIELFTSNPQDMLWVSISDIREQGMFIRSTKEYLTADAVKDYSVKIIPANTVIYSFKMTNGKTSITTQPTTTNEAIAHFVTSRKEIVPYTYFYLRSFKFSSFGSTSSITEAVNSKIIKNMDFILPTNTEIIDFNRIALPLMASIKSNLQEIVKLTDMQTTLLSILSH